MKFLILMRKTKFCTINNFYSTKTRYQFQNVCHIINVDKNQSAVIKFPGGENSNKTLLVNGEMFENDQHCAKLGLQLGMKLWKSSCLLESVWFYSLQD